MVGEPHSSTEAGAAELAHRAVTLDEERLGSRSGAGKQKGRRASGHGRQQRQGRAEGTTGIGEMVQGRSGHRRGRHGRLQRPRQGFERGLGSASEKLDEGREEDGDERDREGWRRKEIEGEKG